MTEPAERMRPNPQAGTDLKLHPIGWVTSPLIDRASALEAWPDAELTFDEAIAAALADVQPGTEIIVLTWLNRARRDVLQAHPHGDPTRPRRGVFSTRSPARPNPIGLHRVIVRRRDRVRLHVSGLDAFDGTPILDVKPVISETTDG